jgi:phenylacetate-coenzyme A ligase PaaK-like adenylate-forming protein
LRWISQSQAKQGRLLAASIGTLASPTTELSGILMKQDKDSTDGFALPPFDPWRSAAAMADVMLAARAAAEELRARRERRLAELLRAAVRGSRLYRELLGNEDPARLRLQDLPVMRKSVLMRRFDDWVTDGELHLDALEAFTAEPQLVAQPFLGRYVVWESSGSSGQPGIFVQDAAALAVYDALEALRRPLLRPAVRMLDPWSLSERMVFVGATGGHFASSVSVERLRRLNPALAQRLHSVSFLQPPDRLLAELNRLAPTVIATYPSAAVLLAEEYLAGRLHVKPRELWTGGETLSSATAAFLREAFDCPVVDSYGASEFLSLACACRHGRLHLNSDWAILEPVDGHGHPVAADRFGATTLLTNLANHVQPLIRYDLGDRVALRSMACDCGSNLPVIEVQGRSDDTLRIERPGCADVFVLPLAVSTVLEDDARLFDFQLVQQGPCELLLRTGLSGSAATAALRRGRAALAGYLERQGAGAVHIHCRSGEPGRRGRSGKIKRVLVDEAPA